MTARTWKQFFTEPHQVLEKQSWADTVESKANITGWAEDDKQAHNARKLSRQNAKKARAGRTSKFTPDTNIETLALNAAEWLADQWPKKVREVGRPVFIAQRVQEILAGTFPADYWDPCPLIDENTFKAIPTVSFDAPQPPAKFVTPGSKNTRCRYTTATPSSGNAGNAGYTTGAGYFVDTYSKQKNYKFQIPEPLFPVPDRPKFATQKATFHVAYSHDNRQSFSNLFKCSLAPAGASFSLTDQAVDATGRFYYWHKKCPKIDPGSLTATMERRFVIDANYKSWNDGYNDDDGGEALIQVAPAPPRGTYRYKSLSVFVDQQNEVALYVARPDDEHDPACAPWVPALYDYAVTTNPVTTIEGTGKVGDPCTVSWYRPRLARVFFGGLPLPSEHVLWYTDTAKTKGINRGEHKTLPVYPINTFDPYAPKTQHPPPGTDLECGPNSGLMESVGLFNVCSAQQCPPHEAYMGWGYRAWDTCAEAYKTHTFAGPAPDWDEFAADWMEGKYPL